MYIITCPGGQTTRISAVAEENFDISLLGHAAVSIHNVFIRAESDNKFCSYTCTYIFPWKKSKIQLIVVVRFECGLCTVFCSP